MTKDHVGTMIGHRGCSCIHCEKARRIPGIFYNVVLSIFSYFVPKKKNQVLLGTLEGEFFGNPKYFFLYLCKNQNQFSPLWITRSKEQYNFLKKKNLPVLLLNSWKGFMAILRSEYFVFSHKIDDVSYFQFLPGRFKKIDAWHGTPIKKIGNKSFTKNPTFVQKILQNVINPLEKKSAHTILTNSEETKKILEDEWGGRIEILGYPRIDVLFDSNLIFEDYEKKLKLAQYKKVILYCPTFRESSTSVMPFTKPFLEKLNDFLKENNYVFLIKTHNLDKDKINLPIYSNIKDVSKKVNDIQDLYFHVDILISDYSSVFFDFVLLDKPIIFYIYDLVEYLESCRDMYYDIYNDMPGPFVNKEDDLIDCLKSIEIQFNNTEYRQKYNYFKNKFNFYRDGKSSERLANHLKNKR